MEFYSVEYWQKNWESLLKKVEEGEKKWGLGGTDIMFEKCGATPQ